MDINKSIKTSVFPQKPKISKVTQISKSEDNHCITNNRPIFFLPNMSKIYETKFIIINIVL